MREAEDNVSNPAFLDAFDEDNVLQVVIETPKGSRNKYAWDAKRRCFALKKVLPAGMVFPYDFGFIPGTKAEDGDEIDVLLLMDEPAFPGCVLSARLIGVFKGEDTLPESKIQRNDRLVAVAQASDLFAHVEHIHNLPSEMRKHMEEFFENYPRVLSHKKFRVLSTEGPEAALALIEQALTFGS